MRKYFENKLEFIERFCRDMNKTAVPQEIIGNSSSRRSWFTNGMAGPRKTGSGTRFACQMQIIKQNNVKPSGTPTE